MFTLDHVVPWGRSFDEYRRMFALSDRDLMRPILGCGDGPASFNAVLTGRGGAVVSVDPLYRYDADHIRERIAVTSDHIMEQVRGNMAVFIWKEPIRSVEELRDVRMSAMSLFLDDYDAGKAAGRYVDAELPAIPFPCGTFDLALCSHFLFLYSAHLDAAFHQAAIREMCRVATEVRIFPLLTLDGEWSPWVEPVATDLRERGYQVTLETVAYEFQRGANQMMRIVGPPPAER